MQRSMSTREALKRERKNGVSGDADPPNNRRADDSVLIIWFRLGTSSTAAPWLV